MLTMQIEIILVDVSEKYCRPQKIVESSGEFDESETLF